MMRETSTDTDDRGKTEGRERWRTVTAFFIFGASLDASLSLFISGAQDILAGTFIQTSLVLVSHMVPSFVVSLIAPYFIQKISYVVRVAAIGLTNICGFLILALVKEVYLKLIGIGLTAVGYQLGEMTFLALSSFYHEVTISAYSAGSGVGLVAAPLYYTAMTTWACVSPQITILTMTAMSLLIFVGYYVMDKKHLESPSPLMDANTEVEYTALDTKEHESDNSDDFEDDTNTRVGVLSAGEKFKVIWQMLPGLIPIYIAWSSEYLTMQAVVTTLAFPNAPFKPRDHYQYYIFLFMAGEVIGRSYLAVLSLIKAEWAEKAKFPYLWCLSIIQVMHLVLFIFAAWYRFLPNVWIVLLFSFTCGVSIGVFFVNLIAFFSAKFKGRYKEFAMGYALVTVCGGTFAAALLGLYTEPHLREHCKMIVNYNNTDFCFTRSNSLDRFTSSCQ